MTKVLKSKANGGSNSGTTASQEAMQSSSAALTPLVKSRPISGTSDSTALTNLTFQATPNSQIPPNTFYGKAVQVFAAKLGTLVEWRKWELADGRSGYGLFFDAEKWKIDPVSKELAPLGEK